jgi:hypothetical protein
MVICGSYIFEISVSKDMKIKDIIKEMAVGKVVTHLCLTQFIKDLKVVLSRVG